MEIEARIESYFNRTISASLNAEDDIFALGIVDSLFAMQLLLFVESEFSLIVERNDLDIKHFCSIAAMTRFVNAKLKNVPASEHRYGDSANGDSARVS